MAQHRTAHELDAENEDDVILHDETDVEVRGLIGSGHGSKGGKGVGSGGGGGGGGGGGMTGLLRRRLDDWTAKQASRRVRERHQSRLEELARESFSATAADAEDDEDEDEDEDEGVEQGREEWSDYDDHNDHQHRGGSSDDDDDDDDDGDDDDELEAARPTMTQAGSMALRNIQLTSGRGSGGSGGRKGGGKGGRGNGARGGGRGRGDSSSGNNWRRVDGGSGDSSGTVIPSVRPASSRATSDLKVLLTSRDVDAKRGAEMRQKLRDANNYANLAHLAPLPGMDGNHGNYGKEGGEEDDEVNGARDDDGAGDEAANAKHDRGGGGNDDDEAGIPRLSSSATLMHTVAKLKNGPKKRNVLRGSIRIEAGRRASRQQSREKFQL